MNSLLESAVEAHGGLDRWNQVQSITFDASVTGAFWGLKGQGDALEDIRLEVDTRRQLVTIDFAGQDKRSVFEPRRVVVQDRDGALIEARDDPERSFDGHQFETPWDDVHLAYFVGEAQWTYMKRLKVTFPDHVTTHTREQVSCFGPDGLLRRHDFTMDILGGAPGKLYATGYRDVGGIIIPTTRRAYSSEGDDQLLMVAIDIGEITIR